MNKIETTVIGSYPVNIKNMEFIKNFYHKKNPSWKEYIKKSADDQVNAGIDIISDGQTKDPFVNIFLRKIKGVRIRNRPEVVDKVEFNGPITVDDQKYLRKIIPEKTKIVGLVAGPYTLTKSCVDMFYNDEKELAFDFSKVLNKELKKLEKIVDIVSVDEPFFSVSYPDYANELIKNVIKNIGIKKRLHVCGDVTGIIPDLLDLPIDILSCEFKAKPNLFEEFKKYSLSKKICLGSVRSDNPKVESVNEIKNHVMKGIEIFDGKISQIAPDCGLRKIPRKNAFEKLKNLSSVGEKIND